MEHAAGTKSQLTQTVKHSNGNMSQGRVVTVNSCFVHIRRTEAGACIGGTQPGQHQIPHIHSQLRVPGTHIRTSVITCPREMHFAEISRKFSAICWFNKTEDCIFPRSFILRFNVQSFNILPSFNLAIVSQAIHNLLHLQNCSYLSTLFGT